MFEISARAYGLGGNNYEFCDFEVMLRMNE